MAEARIVKFRTQIGYGISSVTNRMTSPPKGAWLWSRDPF